MPIRVIALIMAAHYGPAGRLLGNGGMGLGRSSVAGVGAAATGDNLEEASALGLSAGWRQRQLGDGNYMCTRVPIKGISPAIQNQGSTAACKGLFRSRPKTQVQAPALSSPPAATCIAPQAS